MLADRLIATDRKNPQSWLIRGAAHAALANHLEAVADFTWVVTLDPKLAVAYDLRGSEQFKQGMITDSIRDFDKYLELAPESRALSLAARDLLLLCRQVRRRGQTVRRLSNGRRQRRRECRVAIPVHGPRA